jgi:hypothetical protein
VTVLKPPLLPIPVNVNLITGCGPLSCSITVPVTGSETAAQQCENLAQAIRGSDCAVNKFVVVADQCGSGLADFAVAANCGGIPMALGLSNGSPFDQTYLGPIPDGEFDNIVSGPPPAPPVPALSTMHAAGALLAVGAAGLLMLRRRRTSAV